ncbi:transposase [Chryseobacterium sp. T20]|uniref:ISAon1 family transposase N-terminal region protein n=1 Tax=Chryseobacterium sp. T20 TaxID=3395375 RepID=UPI0039BCF1CE
MLPIYFKEKSIIPQEFTHRPYYSNGFHSSVLVEDFPLRGKRVLLHIKRRRWIDKTTGESILRKTIMNHYRESLAFFDKRSTHASAESFNAKIKNFRMQHRGVKDRAFFLFRLTKLLCLILFYD